MAEHGDFQVNCWTCKTQVYSSDTPPPGGVQAALAAFADAQCPIGGTANGCTSTTVAQQTADDERPDRLRQALKALKDARVRGTAVTLPAITAGTPVEVTVVWPSPMPDPVYRIAVTPVHGAGLLGVLRWCLKPGSLAVDGCILIVASTQAVAAGQAGLHVVAAP